MEVVLGVVGIVVSVWIAVWQWPQVMKQRKQLENQEKQLATLKIIGDQTQETVDKLRTDHRSKVVADGFFGLKGQPKLRYKCVFPVRRSLRPLPSIEAGDYYALHVVQNLLGSNRLDLHPVDFEHGELREHHCVGDTIYLCTPQINAALDKILPRVVDHDGTRPHCPEADGQQLPCWFGERQTNDERERGIFVREHNGWIESPAEPAYRHARAHHGVVPKTNAIQKDYAMVMRVTLAGRRVIVLAGIHQYGTWAAAEFFRRVADDELACSEIFLGSDDMAAIIWGEFDPTTYNIIRCDLHDDLLWVRTGAGPWERIPR